MNLHLRSGGILTPDTPIYQTWRASLATIPPAPDGLHVFASLFPMIVDNDRRVTLRDSLGSGQNRPVVLHRGLLLDGRNRARELIELGKPIGYVTFEGDDRQALDFVVAENFERRDLTDHDRIRIASKISGFRLGDNQHTLEPPPIGGPSLDLGVSHETTERAPLSAAGRAAMMNVPLRSVERSDAIDAKGAPELREAVDRRDISIAAAEAVASLPVQEQSAILAALPRDETGKLTPDESFGSEQEIPHGRSPEPPHHIDERIGLNRNQVRDSGLSERRRHDGKKKDEPNLIQSQ